MFGELLQPGVIFELKMHKKVFGDWAPSGLAGRAYRERLQSRSGPDTLAAPQQGRTEGKRGRKGITPTTNSWIHQCPAIHTQTHDASRLMQCTQNDQRRRHQHKLMTITGRERLQSRSGFPNHWIRDWGFCNPRIPPVSHDRAKNMGFTTIMLLL